MVSGLFGVVRRTSALPPKADIRTAIPYQPLSNVRLPPNSGHSEAQERFGPGKRTPNVRLAPNSGRPTGFRWMSAYDPKRTLRHFGVGSDMLALLPQGHRPELGDGYLQCDRSPAAVAIRTGLAHSDKKG